jgi:hypothetical protein
MNALARVWRGRPSIDVPTVLRHFVGTPKCRSERLPFRESASMMLRAGAGHSRLVCLARRFCSFDIRSRNGIDHRATYAAREKKYLSYLGDEKHYLVLQPGEGRGRRGSPGKKGTLNRFDTGDHPGRWRYQVTRGHMKFRSWAFLRSLSRRK